MKGEQKVHVRDDYLCEPDLLLLWLGGDGDDLWLGAGCRAHYLHLLCAGGGGGEGGALTHDASGGAPAESLGGRHADGGCLAARRHSAHCMQAGGGG